MNFITRLQDIVRKHEELNEKLLAFDSPAEYQKSSKEFAELSPIAAKAKTYLAVLYELKEVGLALESNGIEEEMKSMLSEEMRNLTERKDNLDLDLKMMLLPKDEADEKGAILEIRAGTGGEEAALFAANLLSMYKAYSEKRRWKFELLSISSTGIEGCKEATAAISGSGVFARLKFESGVHRVQRVPATESSGRIHTSAATVAILPEIDEIDIDIKDEDIKIDTYRASGAGGQHVNTTDSAIRVTHIPTGVVVCQQDEKSQHKNRAKALKILRSRVYEAQSIERNKERSEARRGMIGSGDRSERIRTYNYPQGRVTDHRVNLTIYNLPTVVNDGELDQFIDKLIAEDIMLKLAEK